MSHKGQKTGDRRLETEAAPKNIVAVPQRGLDRRYDVWSYGLTCCVTAVYLAGR